MTTRSTEEIDWDAYVQDVNAAAKEAFAAVRSILGLPEDIEADVKVNPEEDGETENPVEPVDLSPEALASEAIRVLQLAEASAGRGGLTSGEFVSIADRYIRLAEIALID